MLVAFTVIGAVCTPECVCECFLGARNACLQNDLSGHIVSLPLPFKGHHPHHHTQQHDTNPV